VSEEIILLENSLASKKDEERNLVFYIFHHLTESYDGFHGQIPL